jgi:hypothetical protein
LKKGKKMEKETIILIVMFTIVFVIDNFTNYKMSAEGILIFLVISILLFVGILYKIFKEHLR